ncbi:NADH dehydrogenase [ubiquinone] 1 subunit C2 [Anoplophora glabripennis]|nr:NADH dehydrogenase [ubiquinone] 1 subunit C2 [Anoplophora glabripennis]
MSNDEMSEFIINELEMATGPKIATTPLGLFEGHREAPLLSQIWAPSMCATVGFVSVIFGNWASRRPYFSGIQKHFIAAGVGAALGKIIDDYRNQYFADKDAVLRHYIQLHPEDFPPYERRKIADILEPWVPIR